MSFKPYETQSDIADRLGRQADRLANAQREGAAAEARAAAEAARNADTPADARRIEGDFNTGFEDRSRPNRNTATEMPTKMFSIVIATRNKASYLELTLAALEHQILPVENWEVVVLDDASTDETPIILRNFRNAKRLPLEWQTAGVHRGRAGARNDAIKLAQGRVLVFLDDDMIVPPGFLHWHMIHHVDGPCVVLGDAHRRIHTHVSPDLDADMWRLACLLRDDKVTQPADAKPRRFIRVEDLAHLERLAMLTFAGKRNYAPIFEYFNQKGFPNLYPWVYFHSGNASAPREQVMSEKGFDESFRERSVEDADLSYRLEWAKLTFIFEPRAQTFHQLHSNEPTQEKDREQSLRWFFKKHSKCDRLELEPILRGKVTAVEAHKKLLQNEPVKATAQGGPSSKEVRILWCCRGRGIGYAARDAALLNELRRSAPGIYIRVLTYGPAFRWLASRGFDVLDLGSSASISARVRHTAFVREVRAVRPSLIVSDEELLALAVASGAGIPSVYLTNCLQSEREHPDFGYAENARQIFFADIKDAFAIPPGLKEKTTFCGPWVADVKALSQDWRARLKAQDRRLIVISLGASQGDFQADVMLALNSFTAATAQVSGPQVVILGGLFTERLAAETVIKAETAITRNVLLNDVSDPLGLLHCADLVVTRPDHAILWELAAAGVPTIAIARPPRFSVHDTDYAPHGMEYAQHMAALGSCIYLPDAIASPETLQVVFGEVLEKSLGPKLKEVRNRTNFTGKRRDTVARLLQIAKGG